MHPGFIHLTIIAYYEVLCIDKKLVTDHSHNFTKKYPVFYEKHQIIYL